MIHHIPRLARSLDAILVSVRNVTVTVLVATSGEVHRSDSIWIWLALSPLALGLLQAFSGEAILAEWRSADVSRLFSGLVLQRTLILAAGSVATALAAFLSESLTLLLWSSTLMLAALDGARLRCYGMRQLTRPLLATFTVLVVVGQGFQLLGLASAIISLLAIGAFCLVLLIVDLPDGRSWRDGWRCSQTRSLHDRAACKLATDFLLSSGFGLSVAFFAGLVLSPADSVQLRLLQAVYAPVGVLVFSLRLVLVDANDRSIGRASRYAASAGLLAGVYGALVVLASLLVTPIADFLPRDLCLVFALHSAFVAAGAMHSVLLRVQFHGNGLLLGRSLSVTSGALAVAIAVIIAPTVLAIAVALCVTSMLSAFYWAAIGWRVRRGKSDAGRFSRS